MIASDTTASAALSAVLDAPDLASAQAVARAGLDRIAAEAPSDILEVVEAVGLSGKDASTIRKWAERYRLGRKLGGRWLLSRSRFEAFLQGAPR